MARYDIVHGGTFHAPTIQARPHFCRDWDDAGGCYGTNEDHGFTWEVAREEIAEWHRRQAEKWGQMSEMDYFDEIEPDK
jgi:hypothetical protein